MNYPATFQPYRRINLFQGDGGSVPYPSVSPAQILRSCLIDLGLVLYPKGSAEGNSGPQGANRQYPCFVGSMPDENDWAVRIRDIGGRLFGRAARTDKNLVHCGVDVLVRSRDYTGFMKANAIAAAMDQQLSPYRTQVPEDGSTYDVQSVSRVSPVVSLGEEQGKKRQLYLFEARIVFPDNIPSLG